MFPVALRPHRVVTLNTRLARSVLRAVVRVYNRCQWLCAVMTAQTLGVRDGRAGHLINCPIVTDITIIEQSGVRRIIMRRVRLTANRYLHARGMRVTTRGRTGRADVVVRQRCRLSRRVSVMEVLRVTDLAESRTRAGCVLARCRRNCRCTKYNSRSVDR